MEENFFFWDDNWLGNGSLKQLFTDIYLLNQQHEATVQKVWSIRGWKLTYRRMIQDWEVDRLAEFYGTLDHFRGLFGGFIIAKVSSQLGLPTRTCIKW